MKEVKVKLYRFDELSEDAHHQVCERDRQREYNWGTITQESDAQERIATLDKFCEVFGIDYDLDYDHQKKFINWKFVGLSMSDEEITGKLLWRFLNSHYYDIRSRKYYYTDFRTDANGQRYYKHRYSRIIWVEQNCPFTGMVYDCEILDKIFYWYRKPDFKISLHELFDDCFTYFLSLWESEDDYRMSDENFCDMIEANWEGKLYYEDGTEFNGIFEDAA